jgi:hypothetical protein
MCSQWAGALHATEIPFVFDTVKAKYSDQLTSEDESIARQTNNYWANFAMTGDPRSAGVLKWLRYSTADELLIMRAGGPSDEHDPWKIRLDLTQKLAEQGKTIAAFDWCRRFTKIQINCTRKPASPALMRDTEKTSTTVSLSLSQAGHQLGFVFHAGR